jgi:hypothetical protein
MADVCIFSVALDEKNGSENRTGESKIMTGKLKEKWPRLYGVTQKIGMMEPWSDFSEKDQFVYVWKGEEKSVHFTFLGDSVGKCGIACYAGEEDYKCKTALSTCRGGRGAIGDWLLDR